MARGLKEQQQGAATTCRYILRQQVHGRASDSRKQGARSRQQEAGSRNQTADNRQQTAESRQQGRGGTGQHPPVPRCAGRAWRCRWRMRPAAPPAPAAAARPPAAGGRPAPPSGNTTQHNTMQRNTTQQLNIIMLWHSASIQHNA
jgi:hypothetical protein